MTEEPHIEQATLEDLPQLADLLHDLFSHEADFTPNRNKQMRALRLILEQPSRGRIMVIRHNGLILGMMTMLFTISTAEGGFAVWLEDAVIHPGHRGHGYGGKLLRHIIEYTRRKDFVRISLLADRVDQSLHFFKDHGFVESTMVPMRLVFPRSAEPHA